MSSLFATSRRWQCSVKLVKRSIEGDLVKCECEGVICLQEESAERGEEKRREDLLIFRFVRWIEEEDEDEVWGWMEMGNARDISEGEEMFYLSIDGLLIFVLLQINICSLEKKKTTKRLNLSFDVWNVEALDGLVVDLFHLCSSCSNLWLVTEADLRLWSVCLFIRSAEFDSCQVTFDNLTSLFNPSNVNQR